MGLFELLTKLGICFAIAGAAFIASSVGIMIIKHINSGIKQITNQLKEYTDDTSR